MADDQQLSQQDIQDLQTISSKLPAGHPMQKKLSMLINAQPTQFEKQAAPSGPNTFEMGVAQGMGFDPYKITAQPTVSDQWKETGRQALTGLKNWGTATLKDPFHAIDPIEGMASGLEQDTSDLASAIKQKNLSKALNAGGRLTGAASQVAGAVEAPEGASDTAEIGQTLADRAFQAGKGVASAPGAAVDLFKPKVTPEEALLPRGTRQVKDLQTTKPLLAGSQDLADAKGKVLTEQQRIWQPYTDALAEHGDERGPTDHIGDAISNTITDADVQRLGPKAEKISERAQSYRDMDASTQQLEDFRLQAKAEMAKLEAKYPPDKRDMIVADPEYRAKQAEVQALSDEVDKRLGAHGVDTAAIRSEYGPVKGTRKILQRAEERTAAQQPAASNTARTVGAGVGAAAGGALGGLFGHPYAGAGVGAALGERAVDAFSPKMRPIDRAVQDAYRPRRPSPFAGGSQTGVLNFGKGRNLVQQEHFLAYPDGTVLGPDNAASHEELLGGSIDLAAHMDSTDAARITRAGPVLHVQTSGGISPEQVKQIAKIYKQLGNSEIEYDIGGEAQGNAKSIGDFQRKLDEVFGKGKQTPQQIIESQDLTYKGPAVKGGDVHMFEDPAHPGQTAALKASEITPDSVKAKMASKLKEFKQR